MGYFVYDQQEVEIDDRTLAHLQVVIIDKLRRNESFAMNLADDKRFVTLWVSPRTAVQFVYAGNRRPSLNRGWLERLADGAGMTGTLSLLPEPQLDWPVEVQGTQELVSVSS